MLATFWLLPRWASGRPAEAANHSYSPAASLPPVARLVGGGGPPPHCCPSSAGPGRGDNGPLGAAISFPSLRSFGQPIATRPEREDNPLFAGELRRARRSILKRDTLPPGNQPLCAIPSEYSRPRPHGLP